MRILRGQSNREVSSTGFALFVVGLILATFVGGAVRTVLSSNQVHSRIVAELKNRFPKHEFQIGETEVLLSRGIWPGLGLRVHNLVFKQDVCGKLSFILTIPEATLPLDLLSLRHGRVRLNDVEIQGGGIHLDYHDCATRPAIVDTQDSEGATPTLKHKSIAPPRLNWQEASKSLNGLLLHGFTVTYEKNPTWKLILTRASVSLGDELTGQAQVEVEKSLPFGTLEHAVDLDVHGDKNMMQWNVNADFKEGHLHITGSYDVNSDAGMAAVSVRQVPLKDFMSEMFQMGFVEHDLKLKATWLSCGLKWEGQLQSYDAMPVHIRDCRVEGGYGRAELGQADFWLNDNDYFKIPARLKIAQLELQPLVEALNRQVLPAVIPRLGVWSGDLDFSGREAWTLDGQLQNAEIVFSNQSTHGKQLLESLHTHLQRSGAKILGGIDEVKIHEGDFSGGIEFKLNDNWREGSFRAQIDKLTFSPSIQKIMVGGSVGALRVSGEGSLVNGDLSRWTGDFSTNEIAGEGWRADGLLLHSRFEQGVFHLEGSVRRAVVDSGWHFYPQLQIASPQLPTQVAWRDITGKVEIQKSGGVVQALTVTELPNNHVWRAKGSWQRDGEFNGSLSLGKRGQNFVLHGEKGLLDVQEEAAGSKAPKAEER